MKGGTRGSREREGGGGEERDDLTKDVWKENPKVVEMARRRVSEGEGRSSPTQGEWDDEDRLG